MSDGITKFDHRAVTLNGVFSQQSVWKKVRDPTLASATKLRAQARVRKHQSRKAPPVLTPEALGLCSAYIRCNACRQDCVSVFVVAANASHTCDHFSAPAMKKPGSCRQRVNSHNSAGRLLSLSWKIIHEAHGVVRRSIEYWIQLSS